MNSKQFERINSLLGSSKDALTCDSDCQKKRTEVELKAKYDAALDAVQTAPDQVQATYKNYITFTQGAAAFETIQAESIRARAKADGEKLRAAFDANVGSIVATLRTYTNIHDNYHHVEALLRKWVGENDALQKTVGGTLSDMRVNDRKSYYEDQQIETLEAYHIVLKYIYTAVVLGYVAVVARDTLRQSPPDRTKYAVKYGAVVTAFLLYPLFSFSLYGWLWAVWTKLTSVLPKNVYM